MASREEGRGRCSLIQNQLFLCWQSEGGGGGGEQPDRLGPAPVDSASQRQQGTKTRAQTRENNFWHTLSSADDGFEIMVDLSIDIIRNSSNDSQFLSPNAPLSILCFLCIALNSLFTNTTTHQFQMPSRTIVFLQSWKGMSVSIVIDEVSSIGRFMHHIQSIKSFCSLLSSHCICIA